MVALALLYYISVNAQPKKSRNEFLIDSLKIVETKFFRPQFRIDNRLAIFNKQGIRITGLDAGILLDNRLRITLGYYKLSDKLNSLSKPANNEVVTVHYTLNYFATNFEFIYLNKRFFSLGLPIEFGAGNNSVRYKSRSGNSNESNKGKTGIGYSGLSATFKPIRWIGLKIAFGYRKTISNQINSFQFNRYYSSLGIAIDFREILTDYRMFKLKKQYPPKSNSIETVIDLMTD